ncbi:ABC transporter permease [Brevundimonas sp.]|uniref:ABC transporter permease n=1 Tax=Brevundimonas sp. TaxID=1871086 RepID=UPI00289D6C4A|nr:ABC transporter permease [Brevundimonas sp.]
MINHARIIGALMMRETSTRFGREGIGFAWLILEPLIFCLAVLVLWTLTKPDYSNGIKVSAFMMSGYMCLILLRHMVTYSLSALQANMGLLHHRFVSPIHIFAARNLLEFCGTTIAFIFVYAILMSLGEMSLPKDMILVYSGWVLLTWIGLGFALLLTGLSMRFEVLERVVGLMTYLLVPFSGAFIMVAWMPHQFQELFLYIPFPHPIEMLRAGIFGEFVETHYDVAYAFFWGLGMNTIGIILIALSRDRIDVE